MAGEPTRLAGIGGAADGLLVEYSGSWVPIPDWARFFLDLGRAAIMIQGPGERLVAAIAVPTREFAAAFVAIGAVEARTQLAGTIGDGHFETLCALGNGDEVTVFMSGKKYRGTFDRVAIVQGNEGIYVTFKKDGVNHFLPKGQSHRISVGSLGKGDLPKRPALVGANRRSWSETFVALGLGVDDVDEFARTDDFTALIIGQVSDLQFELEDAPFAVRANGGAISKGHIEDLIRTRKFANDVTGEPFRTEVMSSRTYELDGALRSLNPPVVVFDGGQGFLKHHDDWQKASWIIILDRGSQSTEDASAAFSQYYVVHRFSDVDPLGSVDVPAGIEMSAFLTKVDR